MALPRQHLFLMLALAAVLASCAPVPRLWPAPLDPRIRRDGGLLRVYGASLKSAEAASQDALATLRRYLDRMALPDEDRERRVAQAMRLAQPVAAHDQTGGYSSVVELPLSELQKTLGTDYE